jgi:glyoxylase-like metal-dependent hydrolase (beta-lactamase superfamily II)
MSRRCRSVRWRMRRALLVLAACSGSRARTPTTPFVPRDTIVEGTFEPGRSPDGNSVLLEAPLGWIVVDTGRHPAHQAKLLAHARTTGKPIAAIINTHWHLDHTGGNAELKAAFPKAEIVGTAAVEGALTGFFPQSRKDAEAFLASGQASADQKAEIEGDFAAVDHPETLRPSRPIRDTNLVAIAGRELELHVAPFAATEADLWIWDERTKTVIAGDLVVASIPFLDTACADGWRTALADIAALPFERLIPGHGAPMTRAQFASWRTAFDHLLACAASPRDAKECIAGWKTDAAAFIPANDPRIDGMLGYYLAERLRSQEARDRFCKPLR